MVSDSPMRLQLAINTERVQREPPKKGEEEDEKVLNSHPLHHELQSHQGFDEYLIVLKRVFKTCEIITLS